MVEIDKRISRPQPIAKFFTRYNLPGTLQKQGKDFEWLLLKLEFDSTPA